MIEIKVKPLSQNRAFFGRHFLTKEARDYMETIQWLLPKIKIPEGKLAVKLKFYLSSKNADADNPTKMFVDCLQKKYGFNDRMIYHYDIEKIDVKKGQERIEFQIDKYQ